MISHEYYIAGAAIVVLYGNDFSLYPRTLASYHGARIGKICFIKAPSNAKGEGYQRIVKPQCGLILSDQPDVFAEGVILTESGSAAVIKTADCPTLVLYEANQGRLLITHAGRAALTPTNKTGEPIRNVVTLGYQALVKGCANPDLHAYITGAICGHCFTHDKLGAERHIEPFDQFGKFAFTNRKGGALDLVAVITNQLLRLGVPSSKIKHDGYCTKETTWLTSYRKDQIKRNSVVAVLR